MSFPHEDECSNLGRMMNPTLSRTTSQVRSQPEPKSDPNRTEFDWDSNSLIGYDTIFMFGFN